MCFWEGKNKDMHNDLLLNPKYVEPVEYIFPHDVAPYKPINLSNSKISRLHFHSTFEIGFCCTGNGECTTIDGVFPFNAGDITFFPHINLIFQDHMMTSKANGTGFILM